jgi:hypothetical protein
MLEMFGGWTGLRKIISDVKDCKDAINHSDFKISVLGADPSKSRTSHLYSSTVASHVPLTSSF